MSDPVTDPAPRGPRATDTPSDGRDEDRIVAEAEDGIEDIEDEFGPKAPPRGAAPGNPAAEEIPANTAVKP